MGIYDRDYMKRRPGDEGSRGDFIPLVGKGRHWKWFIIAGLVLIVVAIAILPRISTRHRRLQTQSEQQSTVATAAEGFPLDANIATREELMAIPFLREDTADAIMAARPFTSFKDVARAYGIGPKTLERLKPFLFVSTNMPPSGLP